MPTATARSGREQQRTIQIRTSSALRPIPSCSKEARNPCGILYLIRMAREPGQPEDVGATASQAGEGEPVPEGNVRISQQEVNHRRSKRKTKKRRKDDYEYY